VRGEPCAVLLADDLMVGEPPVLAQMVQQFEQRPVSILAVQQVPIEHTRRYGIVQGDPVPGEERLVRVTGIVEKPAPERSPSRLGVAGRYLLTPSIFEHIRQQSRGVGNEIQPTDGIDGLLAQEQVLVYRDSGKRYDCGSKEGFLEANIELGLRHSQVGAWLKSYLQGLSVA